MKTRYYMTKLHLFPNYPKLFVYKPEVGMTLEERLIPRVEYSKVTKYNLTKFIPKERLHKLLITSYNYSNNKSEYWK
jgi:hypothetical protein